MHTPAFSSRDLNGNPIVVIITVLAALVTIVTFATGRDSLPEIVDSHDTPTPVTAATAPAVIGPAVDPPTAGYSHIGDVQVRNNCNRPIRMALSYRDKTGAWKNLKWWELQGNKNTFLSNNNERIESDNNVFYYYAETTDDSDIAWEGETSITFDGVTLAAKEVVLTPDGDGNWVLTLACDTLPRGNVYLKNQCSRPLHLALSYENEAGSRENIKWWNVDANASTYLLLGDARLVSHNTHFYYYAETTDDSGIIWKGDSLLDFDGMTLATQAEILSRDWEGDWVITLDCDPLPRGYIWVSNQCSRPAHLALSYENEADQWDKNKWWDLAANTGLFLEKDGIRLVSHNSHFYYFAETTDDSGIVWQGSTTLDFDGTPLATKEEILSRDWEGDWVINLSCDPQPRGNVFVRNACSSPIRLALHFENEYDQWEGIKWWPFEANTSAYLASESVRIISHNTHFYLYAEATDQSGNVWSGDVDKQFDEVTLKTREMILTRNLEGDWFIDLKCDGAGGE